MSKLLTIVIPAYNMHDYLHRCLDSICMESVMDDVQVIVVNDGSTDDTSQIAHEYECRYPRYFQVIDKKNGNYGSCMNVALPLAEGKYFRTLDADDWYELDAFRRFVVDLSHTNADLVFSAMTIHRDLQSMKLQYNKFGSSIPLHEDYPIDQIKSLIPDLPEKTLGPQFLTYKTEILRGVKMQWSENLYYTDVEYMSFPMRLVRKIRFINDSVYQYQQGIPSQSMNADFFKLHIIDHMTVTCNVIQNYIAFSPYSVGVDVFQLMRMKVWLAGVYRSLYRDGFKYRKELCKIDYLVQRIPELNYFALEQNEFNGHRYVYAFRHNHLRLLCIHLEYKLKTTRFLRKLFNKD